jgi:hypothetical protein
VFKRGLVAWGGEVATTRGTTTRVSSEGPGERDVGGSADAKEDWSRYDFWKGLAVERRWLLGVRAVWEETVEKVCGEFGEFARGLGGEDRASLERMAKTVRWACVEAWKTRAYQAPTYGARAAGTVSRRLLLSASSLTSVGAGVLAGVGFALLAYLSWGFSPWYWILVLFAAESAAWALVRLFERFVFPGPLHYWLGFPRWPHTARMYARTLVWVGVGVASLSAVLTLSARHHHLSTAEKIGLSAPLGWLAAAIGVWSAVAAQVVGQRVRRPTDPYPDLVLGLLDALGMVCEGQRAAKERGEQVLSGEERCSVADCLERPARAVVANTSMCTPAEPQFSPGVALKLCQQGAQVAAWLHGVQAQVLWPTDDAGAEAVKTKLSDGLKAALSADWETLKAEALPEPKRKKQGPLATYGPRAALTVVLLGAAFGIPALLSSSLSASARATLTVSLVVTAFTALFAPQDAVSTVASDIYGLPNAPPALPPRL